MRHTPALDNPVFVLAAEPEAPEAPGAPDTASADDAFAPLLADRPVRLAPVLPEAVLGTLVALADDGATPLVVYDGQPGTAALRARTTLDLHAAHVGRQVVLAFECGDPGKPLVTGVLRPAVPATAAPDGLGQVQVDADGERLVVTAKDQLVLRCGKASITLTQSGKVLIQGTHVSSRSTGVNRLLGGSVQLN